MSIVLTTLNARYSHSAFGLRYLYTNLNELRTQTELIEFTINQSTSDIAEAILSRNPVIVGFGVYIWNTRQTYDVISMLKRLRPNLKVVLGGPEVSFETESQAICALADLTIQGEADFLFYELCRDYLTTAKWPEKKWISGELPDLASVASPYSYYSDDDIRNRVLYVEASRGCPYKCEYCLSSLDKSVRNFDTDRFLGEMDQLIQRGARQFKFVDRTFNLSVPISSKILKFFLDRISIGLFLHFEMVPDRLPTELRELIQQFPQGALQFEIGIQTWNPEVARLVSRRMDYKKVRENFSYLTEQTGVHIHADLIAGLPGETLDSFGIGFDAVAGLHPQEIQVGILKRLKGTPIARHDSEWQMTYQEHQPFQILQTGTMNFEELQNIGRFSHFWNLIANSGNFVGTTKLFAELSQSRAQPSLFWEFYELSKYLTRRHPQGHGIALIHLIESVWNYLVVEKREIDRDRVREILVQDYTGKVSRDVPAFLRDAKKITETASRPRSTLPSRQRRHLEPQAFDQTS